MRRSSFVIILVMLFVVAFFVTRNKAPSSETGYGADAVAVVEEPKVNFAPSIDNEPEARIATDAIPEAADDVIAANASLRLFEPAPHTIVPSPFVVRGEARNVPSNTVHVQVVNTSGDALINETAPVAPAGDNGFGLFHITLNYQFRHGEEKTLVVFSQDEDGTVLERIEIPLRFVLQE